jgi:hypothetical protein
VARIRPRLHSHTERPRRTAAHTASHSMGHLAQRKSAAGLRRTAVDLRLGRASALLQGCCNGAEQRKPSIDQAFDFPGGPDRTRTCRFRKTSCRFRKTRQQARAAPRVSARQYRLLLVLFDREAPALLNEPVACALYRVGFPSSPKTSPAPASCKAALVPRTDCRSLAQTDSELRLGRPRPEQAGHPICIRRQPSRPLHARIVHRCARTFIGHALDSKINF